MGSQRSRSTPTLGEDDPSLETVETVETLEQHISEWYEVIDEMVETVEYSEDDETVELEQRQTTLVLLHIAQDDEMVETDILVEMVDELDDDEAELTEEKVEADDTVESESSVDEI